MTASARDLLRVEDPDDLFEDDDLNELLDELTGISQPPDPNWRATIRRGRLMLTDWAPFLIAQGPPGALLAGRERAGVTIADLTLHGEANDELSVRYWATGTGREAADELLADWATTLGYRRLWLPDQLLELEPDPERFETAVTSCSTCRSRWSDSTPEFWLGVRRAGQFPKWCPMCGCEMPQWSIHPPDEPAPRQTRRANFRSARMSPRSPR